MRFGIYAETQCPPGKSHYDLRWEIVRQMIHADQVGFDSYGGAPADNTWCGDSIRR